MRQLRYLLYLPGIAVGLVSLSIAYAVYFSHEPYGGTDLEPYDRTDLEAVTGQVVDAEGQPFNGATVVIHWAWDKRPGTASTCFGFDGMGQRAISDERGKYTLTGLSKSLWYDVLIASPGHATARIQIDPSKQLSTTVLRPLKPGGDPSRVFRGRIVDQDGFPLGNALVKHKVPEDRVDPFYGILDSTNPVLTHANGEFEIVSEKAIPKIIILVDDRRLKFLKFMELAAGFDRQTLAVPRK